MRPTWSTHHMLAHCMHEPCKALHPTLKVALDTPGNWVPAHHTMSQGTGTHLGRVAATLRGRSAGVGTGGHHLHAWRLQRVGRRRVALPVALVQLLLVLRLHACAHPAHKCRHMPSARPPLQRHHYLLCTNSTMLLHACPWSAGQAVR